MADEPPFDSERCSRCGCQNRIGSTADERFCFDQQCPARETADGD